MVLQKQIHPYCTEHLVEELREMVDNWLIRADTVGCCLLMNSMTYWQLRRQICHTQYYPEFVYYKNGKIFGLTIKIDNTLPPYRFMIREGDKMNDHILDSFRYMCNSDNLRLPKHWIINKGATILFWSDGTKTIVKRAEEDAHDIAKSFLWAYFQKHSGLTRTKANKYLTKIVEDNLEVV
ncbi:MAG: hypothetical protein IJL74_00605 [Bacilli bacterium]|nr:hypothetical protein [Bacilli bacterium]